MSHLVGKRSDAAHAVADAIRAATKHCLVVSKVTGRAFIVKDVAFELSPETAPLGACCLYLFRLSVCLSAQPYPVS